MTSVIPSKKKGTSTMGNETKNISYNNFDDSMKAPRKQKNKSKRKKKSNLPVGAKRALCIVLLVAVLAGIVAIALITNGTAKRNNIIVESKTGQFDINQQMATFILWQAMYQQGYNEWINEYYTSLYTGSSSSSSSIDFKKYASPDVYAVTVAAYYTKEALNSGLYSIKDYLIELVAGADAAIEAGLKYEAHDKEDVESVVTWVKNIYIDFFFFYFISKSFYRIDTC